MLSCRASEMRAASTQATSHVHSKLPFWGFTMCQVLEDKEARRVTDRWETPSRRQCNGCYNRGRYRVCMETWRWGVQDFYGDPEKGIYKLSRQDLQKILEKTTRVRNITQEYQFYLYCNSGRWTNCCFFPQETGVEGDVNTVFPSVSSKPESEGLQALNKLFCLLVQPILSLRFKASFIPSIINREVPVSPSVKKSMNSSK